jgi:hypothetical protein
LSPKSEAVRVEGLDSTIRALKAIGTPAQEIKKAGLESAELVANSARAIAPRRSGKLISTIKASVLLKGAVVRSGGARAPYSNPIHWGWFFDRDRGFARNIKPNPFFSKALKYRRQDIIDTYEKNMNKLIKEQIARQNSNIKGH